MKKKLRGIKLILSLMISGILSIGLTQAQCPITTTPTVTGGTACGAGSTVTMTGTAGTSQNYIVWYNPSNIIVGSGNTFTTGELASTTVFQAADASVNGPQQHVGPLTNIATPAAPSGNFTNGTYFTVLANLRIDSLTIYTFAPAGGTGSAAGFIYIRDSATREILQEIPFSVTGPGAHQISIGATVSPGSYFMNFTRTSGDGILWRTTTGAVYPYTIPGLVSITGNDLSASNTRYYYFFDWVVTPICVGTKVNVTATIQQVQATTLPYLENFENGLPCDWIRTQATGSPGWQTSTGYTGPLWTVPAHTTFMLSNDAACQCNASQDILVSPMFDLSNYNFLDQLTLTYDAFYTGGGTSMAGVLVSTDGGTTWTPIDTLSANPNWRTETLDLSSVASFDSVRIGFLHTDLNLQGTGFGIDNFAIASAGCNGEIVQVDIITDIYGDETLWQLQDINTNAIYAFHGPLNNVSPYNVAAATYNWDVCVSLGATVEFVIVDTYGDGLFDGNNTGTYQVISPCGDTVLAGSGGYPYGGPGGTAPSYDSVVFTVGPTPIMLGADITICESSTNPVVLDAGYAVNWSTGATNAQTVSILPANLSLGANTVIATTIATGICATADTIVINVDEQPTAAFTEVKNFLVVNFTNTSTGTGAGTTYSWNFGDGSALSTAANPSHTYTSGGTYTVTLTVTNGSCTDVITKTVAVQGIGINDPDLTQSLKIFPNPSNGEVSINIEGSEFNKAIVTLYTIHGQTIETFTLTSSNGSINKTIDLSTFGKGVYFIKVESNEKSVMNRIVIQ